MSKRASPWLVAVVGQILASLAKRIGRTIRIIDEAGAREQLGSVRRCSDSLVFYHWSEDEFPRLVLAGHGGLGLGSDVFYVTDDTIGGQLGAEVLKRFGHKTIEFRASRGGRRIHDIRQILRARGHLSISADGRGPHHVVNPSLAALIAQRNATAVPIGVFSSRAVRIDYPWPIVVPQFGARIAVMVGVPCKLDLDRGLEASRAQLLCGLRELRHRGRSFVADTRP